MPRRSLQQFFLSDFLRNEAGAVAVVLAVALVPLIVGVGAAIDLSRAYIVKTRLSYALDSAGLAVGSSTGSDAELQQVFLDFFQANYPAEKLGTAGTPSMTIVNDVIAMSATANVQTAFMQLVGINNIEVAVDAEVSREISGVEVAMVLDNTGSMAWNGKIGQLRDASHEMINILFKNETRPELLKMALVPFVTTVNIGDTNTDVIENLVDYDYSPDAWKGCVKARPYPHDVQDTDIFSGGKWDPYYWPKEGYYLVDYPSSRSRCTNAWTSWIDTTPNSTIGPNQACPQPMTPLTNDRATLEAAIDEMTPWNGNGTMVNLGAVWGWRALSPDAPFTEGAAYTNKSWKKVMIILTDGQNIMSGASGNCNRYRVSLDGVPTNPGDNPEGDGVNSQYTGYGYAFEGNLGTPYRSQAQNELDNRLAEVCENIKAEGITIYTITFQLNDTNTKNLFETCASDPSKYFDSPTNEALASTFRAIGAELSNLRISK